MVTWENAFKNFDKRLEHDDIDEFRSHLNRSFDKKLNTLQSQYDNASEKDVEDLCDLDAYKNHLEDIMIDTYSSKTLGHELSIIALYKRVEIKTGKVAKTQLAIDTSVRLSFFKNLCKILPFDIKAVNGYNSFNELRLLNNDIKHGGFVTKELSEFCPHWKFGDEIKGLEKDYIRLLPGVKNYVTDLVEKIYSHNQKQP